MGNRPSAVNLKASYPFLDLIWVNTQRVVLGVE
jgi:hypothetical protein